MNLVRLSSIPAAAVSLFLLASTGWSQDPKIVTQYCSTCHSERLNTGEGTAGLLLKDRQLYENMNKVTTDMSALLQEITKDPKKYLNVKVSIF